MRSPRDSSPPLLVPSLPPLQADRDHCFIWLLHSSINSFMMQHVIHSSATEMKMQSPHDNMTPPSLQAQGTGYHTQLSLHSCSACKETLHMRAGSIPFSGASGSSETPPSPSPSTSARGSSSLMAAEGRLAKVLLGEVAQALGVPSPTSCR